ncbi:MAG: N-acetylmuramoyl-L-alanine amidase [Eubacteriales bacterium]
MPKKIKPEKFLTTLVILFFFIAVVLVLFELNSEGTLATLGQDLTNDTQDTVNTTDDAESNVGELFRGLCIVVDAGHGGFDSGAIGTFTGAKEADINLAVSKNLKGILESAGATVVMTRDTDEALGTTKDSDMQARGVIVCQGEVDFMLSIHMNKYVDSSVGGPQVFSYPGSEVSKELAEALQDRLNELSEHKPRVAKEENFYILRAGNSPAVLVECGFLSNEEDDELLSTDSYQQEVARTIFNGLKDFLEEQN